ncbi:MAG TPA: NAD-dependent deacetylase, partial [Verrucomicrobiota bacterium]|nr:NAD-dependent deacetylase [Verrucomicrobiota bacterium]
DEETFRAADPLPTCPFCGELARPNVLMLGDARWIPDRMDRQHEAMNRWLESVRTAGARFAILEFGAGTAIPSVRALSEATAEYLDATLTRINPRESEVPSGQISLPLGAAEAVKRIQAALDLTTG